MKVAISQRIIRTETGTRDALEQSYVRYYERFGIMLIPIPNALDDVKRHLERIGVEGVILSGGDDINPARYGGTPRPGTQYADERDQTETAILDYAIHHNLPVLCQCRGTQMLNVYFGGALLDIATVPNAIKHVATTHPLTIIDASARDYLGQSSITVNSYHNQGFTAPLLAKDLVAFAQASDGTIEGVYHPSRRIAGILWHPERAEDPWGDRLVHAFVKGELFWR